MGALALPIPWIPEDDLLLKNAIEAGASLESLAKGAVQFSRRFTIKELQDRWLALLYDPIISTRAAVQMVELERSAANIPSKSNRGDTSKVNKNAHGKRKAESVRRCYYALRKRVCNEPLNPSDLNFLGDNCFPGNGAPATGNMLGDPIASHFGVDGSEFDELFRDTAPCCAVNEFPIEQHNTIENHMDQHATLTDNMAIEELHGNSLFQRHGIQTNPGFSGKTMLYPEFEGNPIFNPSISDCDNSLQHLQYASPPPAMSDWKTPEGILVTEMPDDISIRGKNVQTRDPFAISDDGEGGGTSEYNVMNTENDLRNSAGRSQGLLYALSESLLNLGSDDDDLMFDGDDGVKGTGKTYFDDFQLLLDSPNDISEDKLLNVLEAKEPESAEAYIDIPNTVVEEKNEAEDIHLGDSNVQNSSQMPTSAACVNSEFPEYRDGVIFCTLNTEDPDIPCNDDVVFPSKPRSASLNKRTQNEANNPSLHCKDYARSQSSGKGQSMIKKVTKRAGESYLASQTCGPDVGLSRAGDDFGVKFETSRAEASIGPRSSCQYSQTVKKEPVELPLTRQPGCSVANQPGQVADLCHLPTAVGGTNLEAQTSSALRSQELHAPSAECIAAEPGGEPSLSDPEEQFSESDADIPYFSDVESMILDMDLGPEDQDFFCSKEVAKYQREDVKRAIIRLEQNAHSYMQRAIASHGAFAILYGRHSKHYIKKPEVMLGRAAEDYSVDIDLGREGRANKISRKQAIIKMGEDGAFYIQNFAKKPIYVDDRKVGSNQSLGLLSNCLIEIRGMPFIFETNQACVKQYLDRKLEERRLNN